GDSAAVAAAMGYYGLVLNIRGLPAEAVPILEEAVRMADKFTGHASPLTLRDRLYLSEAYADGNDRKSAGKLLQETLSLAQAQYGPTHLLTLSASLDTARLILSDGAPAAAEARITSLLPALRKLGTAAEPTLAQALVAHGEALLALHRPSDALAP